MMGFRVWLIKLIDLLATAMYPYAYSNLLVESILQIVYEGILGKHLVLLFTDS